MAKRKSILKYILIGCGTIFILVITSILALYLLIFSGPDAFEINEYHPFRSAVAQEKYLALYDVRAEKWPVPSDTRMVETSYGSTFVRISGPENAPSLVLLHGGGGNSLQWIPNVKALSKAYRVYAIDNIYDPGRSIYIRKMDRSIDMVYWLEEVFTNLELGDEINIVGLSYGGWLASEYALYYPERLGKIVMLAPAATVLPISTEWINRTLLILFPHRHFTKSYLYWLLEDFVNSSEANRKYAEDWAQESYVAMRSFKPKAMVSPEVLNDIELGQIKVPALFLVGENEKIYSAQDAISRLNRVAPDIETEMIPNAGHDLTMIQADLINEKILDFLAKP